jgi:hypothetical protein
MMNPLLPVHVGQDSCVWRTDGLPMHYVPRPFFASNHAAVEAALGREKYAEILYHAGYKSAGHWCGKEARIHGITGMAVFEHYLERLSQGGWGRFSAIEADPSAGCADVRLDGSAFVLAQAETCAATKICHMFSGRLAGAMGWVGEQMHENGGTPIQAICCETQCGAEGYDHCVFAVRPKPSLA